ncbi:hypothetical protein CHS0354_017715 [Potamilus streckersoni]|uniref:P/Homo B domain-containing protein n=1 Tax=Potamilus streckersoni TaxID=2493646 RepID=A0AAE0S397_9BIVA|nr:hypothetical protein CHS0354_017715 [Potamilus streckersoni]
MQLTVLFMGEKHYKFCYCNRMFVLRLLVCVTLFCNSSISTKPLEEETNLRQPGPYVNSFLIEVEKRDIAEAVAREHGFNIVEEISSLNLYHLVHPEVTQRSKRSAENFIHRLKTDARVLYAEQQVILSRVKRTHYIIHDKQEELPIREITDNSVYYRVPLEQIVARDEIPTQTIEHSDPFYKDQWYLENLGQTGGKRGIDMNVAKVWEYGFTGKGVVVAVLDDGIDHSHPDLKRNYDPEASADMNDINDAKNDPMPNKSDSSNSHGTRCAGEIAAECDNNVCGCGIAYNARIGGLRILDGEVTGLLEAKALLYHNQYIDIASASWGPKDDGKTMEAPTKACASALTQGVTEGRKGLGTIFVWATGNGGNNGDSCGADGYVGSIESISIGSVTDQGHKPYFMEECSSTMAVVPTGGLSYPGESYSGEKIKVVTTDINGGCIENFEGTSSAAPLAAGCIALVLEANPKLTWRDIQHIVVRAAKIQSLNATWTINGAGFHVSDAFGFGMMDCGRMVELAQSWTNVPPQHICKTDPQNVNEKLSRGNCVSRTLKFDACFDDSKSKITNLEHIQAYVKVEADKRGEIEIYLTSPSGTRARLLPKRINDQSNEGINFVFMSIHTWGENPQGIWKIEVCHGDGGQNTDTVDDVKKVLRRMLDRMAKVESGRFISWELRAYGYDDGKSQMVSQRARIPSLRELQQTMEKEMQQSKTLDLKRGKEVKDQKMDLKDNLPTEGEIKKYFEGKIGPVLDDLSKILQSRQFTEDDLVVALARSIGESGQDADQPMGYNSDKDLQKRNFYHSLADEELDDGTVDLLGKVLELKEEYEKRSEQRGLSRENANKEFWMFLKYLLRKK